MLGLGGSLSRGRGATDPFCSVAAHGHGLLLAHGVRVLVGEAGRAGLGAQEGGAVGRVRASRAGGDGVVAVVERVGRVAVLAAARARDGALAEVACGRGPGGRRAAL